MAKRAVFLDLNGTLVLPLKQESLSELVQIDGADEAVARLSRAGYVCPVVTIQSRIAKGLFSEGEFRRWFREFAKAMRTRGAFIEGPYVCPHRHSSPCACQKPNDLLYRQAASEHGIDLLNSFVVGDTPADVQAAEKFGGTGILVKTGWARNKALVDQARPHSAYIAESLAEAVDWILMQRSSFRKTTRRTSDRHRMDFVGRGVAVPGKEVKKWLRFL